MWPQNKLLQESENANMPNIGGWEWVIILVVVLLLFGVGRLSKIGSELGRGIREFRKELKGDGNPPPRCRGRLDRIERARDGHQRYRIRGSSQPYITSIRKLTMMKQPDTSMTSAWISV